MDPNLHDLLLERLSNQGVDRDEAPALLRDLKIIFETYQIINPVELNSKLNLLGWNGVALDYQSLQLALALLEFENPGWFPNS